MSKRAVVKLILVAVAIVVAVLAEHGALAILILAFVGSIHFRPEIGDWTARLLAPSPAARLAAILWLLLSLLVLLAAFAAAGAGAVGWEPMLGLGGIFAAAAVVMFAAPNNRVLLGLSFASALLIVVSALQALVNGGFGLANAALTVVAAAIAVLSVVGMIRVFRQGRPD
ncbi:MAG: hypothetical protein M3N29_01965 [Chloroflexota bacterium]|nr:hypothetical protein [Chloroflexota bacterium]